MSEHNDLTTDQLLDVDWYKNNGNFPQQVVKKAFYVTQQNPNVRMLRSGNTILVLDTVSKNFHFINADGFEDFVANVKDLLARCDEREIKTDFTNPLIIRVAEQTGMRFNIEAVPDGYIMTVRL